VRRKGIPVAGASGPPEHDLPKPKRSFRALRDVMRDLRRLAPRGIWFGLGQGRRWRENSSSAPRSEATSGRLV
jgi:hypothetical protein